MTASRVLAIVLLVPLFALACASRSGPLQSSCPICDAMCPEPPPPPPPPRRAAPPPPPPPPPPARAPARIVLRGVNFGFDSASIDPASAVVLEVGGIAEELMERFKES